VVTGTLFASFTGGASGSDVVMTSTITSREVIQPNGSATRSESNGSRGTNTQHASISSLTVGATGFIRNNAEGTGGNVSLGSGGGDAIFTLDGGRVSGRVDLAAGIGTSGADSSDRTATFTRGPSTNTGVAPEVQQSRTTTSSSERRAAAGTATATINSGTIGQLIVSGTGRGAGSLGANVLVNGTVSGSLTATALATDTRSTSNEVVARTGPNATAGSSTSTYASAPAANRHHGSRRGRARDGQPQRPGRLAFC
jgi:hypothetical protein